ncbi:MAG: hypothetical protein ACKO5J_05745 [Rubrivivax sp.]
MAHTRLNPLLRWARSRQRSVEQPDFGDHGTAFGLDLSLAPGPGTPTSLAARGATASAVWQGTPGALDTPGTPAGRSATLAADTAGAATGGPAAARAALAASGPTTAGPTSSPVPLHDGAMGMWRRLSGRRAWREG